MNTMHDGAVQVVKNCLKIKEGEKLCIITDKDTYSVAESIIEAAKPITDKITLFVMEDFGKRDNPSCPLKLPEEMKIALENSDVSIYAAGSRPGEIETFRHPMHSVAEKNRIRHAHMIGITEEIMKAGMCADYEIVEEVTKKVHNEIKNADMIRVTTPKGTDIIAHFDKNIRWCVFDGNITKDMWMNLPEGEIFTCPKNIEGTAIIDGVLGDYFDQKYGMIKQTPVTLKISEGRVKEISCSNRDLETELKKYIKTDKNSDRIGEFAIGTNLGIKKIIGNMLQDEKFPGVHIAMGNSFPEITGSGWECPTHIDGVMLNCTIIIDGKKTIMKNGKFLI